MRTLTKQIKMIVSESGVMWSKFIFVIQNIWQLINFYLDIKISFYTRYYVC